MSSEIQQINAAITALEAQRSLLGNSIVDTAVAPLRARLATLTHPPSSEASEPKQTLKQATILFLDIVGSTPLSLQLDPEEFHATVDSVLRRGTTVVEDLGGKVISYAGDNLIAVFGGVEAREDATERAVRAGLGLLEIGRTLHDEVLQRYAVEGSNVRVGIHTGPVLLGGGVQADNTISGLSVNVAARMEQTAPPGSVRISHTTYAMVRGVFEVVRQPPMDIKGLSEPMLTYLVLRPKPPAFRIANRGIEGMETRMVGRDAEIEILQDSFRRVFSEPKLAVVTVVGDAGIGKSRLLYEFQDWVDSRPEPVTLFQGRANPQTQNQPYGMLRDILAARFQFSGGDSMAAAKDKLVTGMKSLSSIAGDDIAEEHAHLLGELLGLDFRDSRHIKGILHDAKQIRNRGFFAAAKYFRHTAQSSGNPVVLQLDDLHWADDASLDFFSYLIQVSRDVPLIIIGLARPTFFDRRPDWVSAADFSKRVDLLPLDKTGSRLLVNDLLKNLAEIPTAMRDLITSGADGNPFYMEELVQMLLDQGAIETLGELWTVNAAKLIATNVPATLTGVLQARLDALPAEERLALQQASVIGMVFWDQALSALDVKATQVLPNLVRRELTLPRSDTRLDTAHEYAFRHQILHQVTYDTLLKRTKRELHGRTADWLSTLTGARANDFLGETARNYSLAGEDAKAVEYFSRAAEQAKVRYLHDAALGHVASGLSILDQHSNAPSDDAESLRWRLLDVREHTLGMQGKRDQQRADLDALDDLALRLKDNRRKADLAKRRSQFAMHITDFVEQERSAKLAMEMAKGMGDSELYLESCRLFAFSRLDQGDIKSAKSISDDGHKQSRQLGLRRMESLFLNCLSHVAAKQDKSEDFLELTRQGLEIDRELGDKAREAIDLGNLGTGLVGIGNLSQGRSYLQSALKLCHAVGDRVNSGAYLISLSRLELMLGEDAQALALARQACEITVEVQAANYEAVALCCVGDAELSLGRPAQAADAFARAETILKSINSSFLHNAVDGRARVALSLGDVNGALACLENVISSLSGGTEQVASEYSLRTELTCYRALVAAGDARAAQLLDRTYAELQVQTGAITDESQRKDFLTNIPEHREIVAEWKRK
jgi:class 3 adenylate cyclase